MPEWRRSCLDGGMASRSIIETGVVSALSALLLSGCAQGTLGVSPGTIVSTIVLLGERVGSGSTSTESRAPTSRSRLPASPAPSAMAERVLGTAEQYIGVRYTWGGNTPRSGFDCSGFTKYVFAREGIELPRTSREQARAGEAVAPDFNALVPGDIMLFAEPGAAISHVAIYAGNGRIIHSSSTNSGVGYLDLSNGRSEWFVQYFVAARRLL